MQYFICADITVKPCPCCGKKAQLWSSIPDIEASNINDTSGMPNANDDLPVLFWVQCTNDGCGVKTKESEFAEICIAIWHRRQTYGNGGSNNKASAPTTKTTGQKMVQVSHEAYRLFLRKNADYGDSFARSGVSGIMVRLLDKLSRAVVISQNSVQIKTESLRDSLLDISNYALMGVVLLDSETNKNGRVNKAGQINNFRNYRKTTKRNHAGTQQFASSNLEEASNAN